MSKSLKKLIDINRLREFKNKLVGTDSDYVQTGAVDQTVAGTKAFSEPIVGSVTGSSGSCTGNAATATTAGAVNTVVAADSTKDLVYAHMADSDAFRIRCGGGSDAGYLEIATSDNGNEPIYVRQYNHGDDEPGAFNRIVRTLTLLDDSGNTSFPGTVTATGFSGPLTGNAATATKLATARTIALSGAATGTATGFDGSGNITIPVTSLDASKLTGTASVSTTGNAASANIATKATQDAAGNTITTTYATKAENNTKANNSEVVHKSGDETIAGTKTFSNGVLLTNPNALMAQNGEYTLVLRHDSRNTYLLMSDKGGVPGTWSDARPLTISNSTGVCSINGNADTATKLATARTIALSGAATGTATGFDGSGNITIPVTSLDASKLTGTASVSTTGNAASANIATKADSATNATYANWLRTSSHSNHLFHSEWDGSYFWTYVTSSNGGYRAVRVARSDSSGNAATATKLATARTIALSGAATGTATGFDGSGNITIPVTALASSAIRAQWYAAYPDGAEAHNAMWGGRDITAAFDSGEFSEHVADGTFRDIFPGDYITKQVTISGTAYTVNWVIADCDYWIYKGDTAMTAHHVVIVPQAPIFNVHVNDTNTTEGGYASSWLHTYVIPPCATGIVSAFGSDHILTFRDAIPDRVDTSHVSSGLPQWIGTPGWWGVWHSEQCNLMSEKMVYGAPVCSGGAMNNAMATRQMSAFRLSEKLINYNRQTYWLRDVVSSTAFASVYGYGHASARNASDVTGVRPFALLK